MKRNHWGRPGGTSILLRLRRLCVAGAVVAVALLLVFTGVAPAKKPRPASAVYLNGYVHTVDIKKPRAQAVAVRGAKIVFVGANRAARSFIGPRTKVIDLKGRLLMPGLVDSHCTQLVAARAF